MRSTVMLVVVLTLVCLISAFALALVNGLTEDRIAEQKRLAELRAVEVALPRDYIECENDPSQDVATVSDWKDADGAPKKICVGKKDGKIVGVAFTSKGEGYGGFITIMMGVNLNGKITGVEILEHLETPGLGANIEKSSFKGQFKGKFQDGAPDGKLQVVKGRKAEKNWEVEALTGATVSPRGIVQALNNGLAMFEKHKKQILVSGTLERGAK